MRTRGVRLGRIAFVAALGSLTTAVRAFDDSPSPHELSPATVIAARGEWRSGAGGERRSWSVEGLRVNGNEIQGRIESGLLGGANVEARLSGRGVTGKLLDDEGRTVVVFEGAVGASSASGTFRHVGGGAGTWSWERPPGQAPGLPGRDGGG